MNKTRILSLALFVVALCLAYYLGYVIYEPIKRQKEITKIESGVIRKLEMIREAQKEYFTAQKKYAGKWQDLIAFVDTGISYDIQKNEQVIMRPIELRHLGDSILVTYDTLGSMPVIDKLFPKSKYPDFDLNKLQYVPNKDFPFELYAGTIDMGGVPVQVVQVMDPKPEDKTRRKDHEFRQKRNLNFGSREKASLDGNWKENVN